MVVGASDRMLTAGDTEFEPHTPKIWWFGGKIAALTAGDSAIQRSCFNATMKNLSGMQWDTKEVADMYAQEFLTQRQQIARPRC